MAVNRTGMKADFGTVSEFEDDIGKGGAIEVKHARTLRGPRSAVGKCGRNQRYARRRRAAVE